MTKEANTGYRKSIKARYYNSNAMEAIDEEDDSDEDEQSDTPTEQSS